MTIFILHSTDSKLSHISFPDFKKVISNFGNVYPEEDYNEMEIIKINDGKYNFSRYRKSIKKIIKSDLIVFNGDIKKSGSEYNPPRIGIAIVVAGLFKKETIFSHQVDDSLSLIIKNSLGTNRIEYTDAKDLKNKFNILLNN